MPVVVCPVCSTGLPVTAADAGRKLSCRQCGQRMLIPAPPAANNKTVLARWDDVPAASLAGPLPPKKGRFDDQDDSDRPTPKGGSRHCPRCDREVTPKRSKQIPQPHGWVLIALGFLFAPLLVVALSLRQKVEKCPECKETLYLGPTRFWN